MLHYRRWKFRILLVALLALFLLHSRVVELPDGRFVYAAVWSLAQIATLFAVSLNPKQRFQGLAFGVPTLVGILATHLAPRDAHDAIEMITSSFGAAFFSLVAVMIMHHLLTHEVTTDNVVGAVCAYMLLGIGASQVYAVVETLYPGSFQAGGATAHDLADPALRNSVLAYFSFVTLTTSGYGDITPATPLTRILAVMEAVTGQFYLAVLVAGLIGLKVSKRPAGEWSGEGSRQSATKTQDQKSKTQEPAAANEVAGIPQ
jgi:hypothetical protein